MHVVILGYVESHRKQSHATIKFAQVPARNGDTETENRL